MNTMKAPVISKLAITARGMFLRGLRASPPRVVALSKPTREKTVMTTARLRSWMVMPCTLSCAVSVGNPCLNRITNAKARMQATEAASNSKVNSEEILMSLYATSQHTAAEMQKKITGGIVVWMPMDD